MKRFIPALTTPPLLSPPPPPAAPQPATQTPNTHPAALTAAAPLPAPAPAEAPQLETQAPIAFLIDLTSGAVLLAKNADQRIPPASMAKMMTTEVASELTDAASVPPDK